MNSSFKIWHKNGVQVLYTAEIPDDTPWPMRVAVEQANAGGVDLRDAYLKEADLRGANLSKTSLISADLSGADLSGADLSYAELELADLSDATLVGTKLTGADLGLANLRGTCVSAADLFDIRGDLYLVLDAAPNEVSGLLTTLRAGEIDGSTYSGPCSCLVGTIAAVRGCNSYSSLAGLAPNASRPAERWFLAIREGDTPFNSEIAEITEDWIIEWQGARK